jgi:hypothetical protein
VPLSFPENFENSNKKRLNRDQRNELRSFTRRMVELFFINFTTNSTLSFLEDLFINTIQRKKGVFYRLLFYLQLKQTKDL